MRSALTVAALLLVSACRENPPPPTPRLVGTASPAGEVEAREDAVGLGGAGEAPAEEDPPALAEPARPEPPRPH